MFRTNASGTISLSPTNSAAGKQRSAEADNDRTRSSDLVTNKHLVHAMGGSIYTCLQGHGSVKNILKYHYLLSIVCCHANMKDERTTTFSSTARVRGAKEWIQHCPEHVAGALKQGYWTMNELVSHTESSKETRNVVISPKRLQR